MTWRETLAVNGWTPMTDAHDGSDTGMMLFVDGRPKWQVRACVVESGCVAAAFGNGFRIAFGEGATEDEAFADLLSKRVEPGGVTAAMVLGLALPAGGG
jgi:phage-related minor tail protein